MKLKEGFILHDVGGQHMAVTTGAAADSFNGMVRNNDTANFIFQLLMEDTTEEAIVDQMVQRYNAPRERIAADVHNCIQKMRENGFLDETV